MNELWANIIGGVVAALVIAGLFWLKERRKHRILKELTEIMGKAIVHRNSVHELERLQDFTAADEWIQKARALETEAVAKAYELSPSAGALVEWLDRIDPYIVDIDAISVEIGRYTSILNKVIERIRELLERNS